MTAFYNIEKLFLSDFLKTAFVRIAFSNIGKLVKPNLICGNIGNMIGTVVVLLGG